MRDRGPPPGHNARVADRTPDPRSRFEQQFGATPPPGGPYGGDQILGRFGRLPGPVRRAGWEVTDLAPAAGRLLLATPLLVEPTFARTVVFLLEHDDDGTVGVVVNRPSRTPVGQVLPSWHASASDPDVVFTGGPVQPDGALCLGEVRPGGRDEVVEGEDALRPLPGGAGLGGVLATVDLEADGGEVAPALANVRIYAGHSGWAGGQLADEIAQGAWIVVDGGKHDVFSRAPSVLWRQVLRRQPPPLSLLATYPPELADN